MTNASEQWLLRPRFYCEWEPRADSALGLAERLQKLARAFGQIEPAYRNLGLIFPRPLKWVPLTGNTVEDIAKVIDRRARFDPPQLPAPVSPEGYSPLLDVDRNGLDPLSLGLSVHAGVRRPGIANKAHLDIHPQSPVWADQRLQVAMMDALLDAFDPQWAYAGVVLPIDPFERQSRYRIGASLSWALPRAILPDRLELVGSSSVRNPLRGGDLTTWS